jgi:hypothetical protein
MEDLGAAGYAERLGGGSLDVQEGIWMVGDKLKVGRRGRAEDRELDLFEASGCCTFLSLLHDLIFKILMRMMMMMTTMTKRTIRLEMI